MRIISGIARGKKLFDKRQDIAKKDAERRMQKVLKSNEKNIFVYCYKKYNNILLSIKDLPELPEIKEIMAEALFGCHRNRCCVVRIL